MPGNSDETSAMPRDIVEVLPFEIWQRCIAYACHGDHYMAILLKMTMVSRRWCRLLLGTPTLWAIIHVNDGDEDSLATIATFLHLSCKAQLSLVIWIPLSEKWDTIYGMILPHRDRIRGITLQVESKYHSAECTLKSTISDAKVQRDLQYIFNTLRRPPSIQYLDVISDRPIRMGSLLLPSSLVLEGNWVIPLWALDSSSDLFGRLRHLSISSIDLGHLFPNLSAFVRLQSLHLHADEPNHIHPPSSTTNGPAPPHLPLLKTLRYEGRLYWAPTRLLNAVAPTIQRLELHIEVFELEEVVSSLEFSKSLRRFSLMLDYDLERDRKWRCSNISIPKWRLKRLQDFRCEMKSFGNGKLAEADHLRRLFHTIFPRLHTLVWNLPILSGTLISLGKQNQLKHFESNVVSTPLPIKVALNTLESLRIQDAQMLRGVAITKLRHFSATFQEEFKIPAGFTFALLHSLDLTIGESVEIPCDINGGDFPVLKVLSITFLSPRCHFQPLNLPSLTEITISTRLPTFTQAMEFCAFLISDPRKCPRLEQVSMDSFLEWDVLHLLLWRRNFLEDVSVSRIKRLSLPFLPPKYHPMFVSLLAGRPVLSLPSLWTLMTHLSIQGARSRLLDQEMIGCFCCVQLGLTDCDEPLHASRLPEEYRTSREENRVFSDIIDSLGLFPLYSWDIEGPVAPKLSAYESIWMEGHRNGAAEWRNAAYEWSKLHHRTLICHKQLCSPKVVVTEYDMGDGESGSHTSMTTLFCLVEYPELRHLIRGRIQSLIQLLQDQDYGLRSDAASTLAELAEHVGQHDAMPPAIPRLIELLKDPEFRLAATSSLTKLAEHGELRDAIRPAIPLLIELLKDRHLDISVAAAYSISTLVKHVDFRGVIQVSVMRLLDDQGYGILKYNVSTLAKLAENVELRGAIRPTISLLIEQLKDQHPNVQSATNSALVELAEHVELRNMIRPAIPQLIELLKDQYSDVRAATTLLTKLVQHAELRDEVQVFIMKLLKDRDHHVRSDTTSRLVELAEHVGLRDAIQPAIPQLIETLKDSDTGVQSAATSALAKLAKHVELRDAIRPAIPQIIELLQDRQTDVQAAAISALAKLAEHVELREVIYPAIPHIIELLKDSNRATRSAAVTALSQFAEHIELREVGDMFRDDSGRTALSWAAGSGYDAVVRLLVTQQGIGINTKDNSGRTPLSWAAANGHDSVVRLLLTHDGVDAISKDENDCTPLSLAKMNGHHAVERLLLALERVDENDESNPGRRPLNAYFPWNRKKTDPLARARTAPPWSNREFQPPPPPPAQSLSYLQLLRQRLQKYQWASTFSVDCSGPQYALLWRVSFYLGSTMIGESSWFTNKDAAKENAAMQALGWLNTYGYQ